MTYEKTVTLKDGAPCRIRTAAREDAAAMREIFLLTHGETDYLLSYPDECTMTAEGKAAYLAEKAGSARDAELCAEVNDRIVGSAGVGSLGEREKLRHRCSFGISVLKAHWGRGAGKALAEAAVECARKMGYEQMELEVVADNARAVGLYERLGFEIYGRNPRGFKARSGYQEVLLMRLEL